MNNLVNWFTKKRLIIVGLLGSSIFFLSVFIKIHIPVDVCYQGEFCGDVSELLRIYFLVFIPIFILSLITYKLKDSTFTTWRNFSIWLIPALLFFTSLFPTFTHGLDFLPIVKGTVNFFLVILYFIISLILIFYKSLKKEELK